MIVFGPRAYPRTALGFARMIDEAHRALRCFSPRHPERFYWLDPIRDALLVNGKPATLLASNGTLTMRPNRDAIVARVDRPDPEDLQLDMGLDEGTE